MFKSFGLTFIIMFFAHNAVAELPESLKLEADAIAKAGSVAAAYAELSAADLPEEAVIARFEGLGEEVQKAAILWSRDPELRDSPPAFRRFLFFDYLSQGRKVVAAASNPDDLLINADAAVDAVFDDPALVMASRKMMEDKINQAKHVRVGDYLLGGYPMIPPAEKAAGCIACHASAEVDIPYPENAKILGYTFVALPLK